MNHDLVKRHGQENVRPTPVFSASPTDGVNIASQKRYPSAMGGRLALGAVARYCTYCVPSSGQLRPIASLTHLHIERWWLAVAIQNTPLK